MQKAIIRDQWRHPEQMEPHCPTSILSKFANLINQLQVEKNWSQNFWQLVFSFFRCWLFFWEHNCFIILNICCLGICDLLVEQLVCQNFLGSSKSSSKILFWKLNQCQSVALLTQLMCSKIKLSNTWFTFNVLWWKKSFKSFSMVIKAFWLAMCHITLPKRDFTGETIQSF